MKHIFLVFLVTIGLLFFVNVRTVKAYCGGGTWMGFDRTEQSCNDIRCDGDGSPYEWCSCEEARCDYSSAIAAETCSDYTSEGSCTTPGGWECNNGVSCSWQDESTPTPIPDPPTPTRFIPPTEPPPPHALVGLINSKV